MAEMKVKPKTKATWRKRWRRFWRAFQHSDKPHYTLEVHNVRQSHGTSMKKEKKDG